MGLRACAVVGDRTTTGGVIVTGSGGRFMTIDTKAVALWGDVATCPACGVPGKIVGEVFPSQTVNGLPVARHNDLVLCQCLQKPRVIALGIQMMVSDHWSGMGTVGDVPLQHGDSQIYDRHFQLVDEATQRPLAGRRYRLTWPGESIEGVANASGLTQRVRLFNPEDIHLEVLPEGD